MITILLQLRPGARLWNESKRGVDRFVRLTSPNLSLTRHINGSIGHVDKLTSNSADHEPQPVDTHVLSLLKHFAQA